MHARHGALVAALAIAAGGCVAANPNAIRPMSISTVGYDGLDCAALAREDARVAAELGPLIYYQRQRRTADAAGIILVGLSPTGLGSPEHGAAIARLKGERETVAKVKATKGCAEPPAAVIETRPLADIRAEAAAEQPMRGVPAPPGLKPRPAPVIDPNVKRPRE